MSILITVLLLVFLINSASASTTVSIDIHRIQLTDQIECIGEGEADWYFHVGLGDGDTEWKSSTIYKDSNDIQLSKTFTFTTNSLQPYIYIMLNEEDAFDDDLADISSDKSPGVDNLAQLISPAIGDGVFESRYKLDTNQLSGDMTEKDGSLYKTSGDFDNNIGDENDANLWFRISDNYELPTANAGNDKNCKVGDLVNFNGIGMASSGSTINRYQWDFNNDGIFDSEGQTTSHTYSKAGTYIVKLKVTDDYGKESSDTMKTIVKSIPPIVGFVYTPSSPYTSDSITFTDTSTDQDGTISSWSWDFGDSKTSKVKNPSHKYQEDGKYTVILKVIDNDGTPNTESKVITIKNIKPNADFSFSPLNPSTKNEITFTDTSTDQDGTISSWSWDFGDGYTSKIQTATHKFANEKTHFVKLTITDNDGASDSKTKDITVEKSTPLKTFVASKTPSQASSESTPGFGIFIGIIGILLMAFKKK